MDRLLWEAVKEVRKFLTSCSAVELEKKKKLCLKFMDELFDNQIKITVFDRTEGKDIVLKNDKRIDRSISKPSFVATMLISFPFLTEDHKKDKRKKLSTK